MRRAPRSLRGRITLVLVVVVGVVLTVAAVLIVAVQRGQLIENIDDSLDREAADVVEALAGDTEPALGQRGQDRFTQVIDEQGRVIASTPNLSGVAALLDPQDLRFDDDDADYLTSSRVPIEDDDYRLLARRVEAGRGALIVIVGENTDDLDDSIRVLIATLAVLVPLATAILGVAGWLMVGRTLSPVASIRRQVSHITLHRLGDRVPVPESGDEIAELARTMNEMLDRLDAANARQQHFVADASHELRSPLTRLRTSLEVDLADPDRDLNETGRELLHDIEDLQSLVDDLLFLARTDDEPRIELERVDLDAVVDRVVDRLGSTRVPVDTRDVEPVEVHGNEGHLSRLVTNLVANALRHADQRVWLAVAEVDGMATLTVEDDGPGIEPADRARVFERFTRLDDARSGGTGGAGLGLAIAQEIASAHGGTIGLLTGRSGGARFVVTVPQSPTAP